MPSQRAKTVLLPSGQEGDVGPYIAGGVLRAASARRCRPISAQRPMASGSAPASRHNCAAICPRTSRGLAGIIAGAVLLIIAVITARAGRRSSRYY